MLSSCRGDYGIAAAAAGGPQDVQVVPGGAVRRQVRGGAVETGLA